MTWTSAFAPATIANVGPGFDVLGMAVHPSSRLGDTCAVRLFDHAGPGTVAIAGDGGRLPTEPSRNVASVAAQIVLERAGHAGRAYALRLRKGLPLGSGLGSSAASAAAAALAVNRALGNPLTLRELIPAVRAGEALAAGSPHADNAVPALLGGANLVIDLDTAGRGADGELLVAPVPIPKVAVVLAVPDLEVPTAMARRAIPKEIPHHDAVHSAGRLALLVAALFEGRADWLTTAVDDRLHEPYRAPLIKGFDGARRHARAAGALAVGISGSGPATFAFVGHAAAPAVATALVQGFAEAGVAARAVVTKVAPARREVKR